MELNGLAVKLQVLAGFKCVSSSVLCHCFARVTVSSIEKNLL